MHKNFAQALCKLVGQGKVEYQKWISNIKEAVEKCIKEGQINEIFSNKNVSIAQQNLLNKTINKKSSYSNWPVDYFIKIKISPNIRQIIIQRIIYFNELIEITLLLFARYLFKCTCQNEKEKIYTGIELAPQCL